MDQSEDPRELERKIDQATRIASRINDQTTVERLRAWIEDAKAEAAAASGGETHQAGDQCTRSGNLGTERMPSRPRLGVLASSRV